MYKRKKTTDMWHIHVNYGHGWEYECKELTRRELTRRNALVQVKCYRENCPYTRFAEDLVTVMQHDGLTVEVN